MTTNNRSNQTNGKVNAKTNGKPFISSSFKSKIERALQSFSNAEEIFRDVFSRMDMDDYGFSLN